MLNLSQYYKPNWLGSFSYICLNIFERIYIPEIISAKNYIFLVFYDKNNNIKKIIYAMQEKGNYISEIQFTLNKRGCGECTLFLTEKIDFEIKAQDILEIFLNGKKIYRGFATNDLNLLEKQVKFYPFSIRLGEFVFSGVYTNKTIKFIINSIISNIQSKFPLKYDESKLEIYNNEPFSFEWVGEKIGNIFDKLVNLAGADLFWGVDEFDYFYVKKENYNQNAIAFRYIPNTINKFFSDLKIKIDYSDIKATRYKVYKNDNNKMRYLGEVTNTDLESLTRITEDKFVASEKIGDSLALQVAEQDLIAKNKAKNEIAIKNLNLQLYKPKINDVILINTKSFYDFDNDLISGYKYFSFSGGVYFLPCWNIHGFLYFYPYKYITELNFNYRALTLHQDINFKVYTTNGDFTIFLPNTNEVWQNKKIVVNSFITQIEAWGWGTSGDYMEFKDFAGFIKGYKIIIEPISEIKYKINGDGVKCDIKAGQITEREGEQLFELNKKVRIIETILSF